MLIVEEKPSGSASAGRLKRRVQDAGLLMDYAIETGKRIDSSIIEGVRQIQVALEKSNSADPNSGATEYLISVAMVQEFDQAYLELSALMSPVRGTTLRATDADFGRPFASFGRNLTRSEAEIWSFKLWMYTGLALVIIGWTELSQELSSGWYPLDPGYEKDVVYYLHLSLVGLNILLPFVYGLLGACLSLLPKCHEFVSARTFDPLRIAEYKSRMLMGLASGGIVMFFVHEISLDEGDEFIQLSAPVLAIIAGYNTDFIFETIERMVAAILPKVGVKSARPAAAPSPVVRPMSVEAIAQALLSAENEDDKKVLRSLLTATQKGL